jgi:hypothetical protein
MSVIDIMKWDQFFKPETRSRGQKLIDAQIVSTSAPSDTEVSGFVKGYKVKLRCESVTSLQIKAQCSCSKKLCQHVWAVLQKALEKHPDFFYQKEDLEMDVQTSSNSTFKQEMKDRQNSYRKTQYQKIKQKLKDQKNVKIQSYPEEVEKALQYFSDNGFSFENPKNVEAIQISKKKLARVFHPDLGGSHDEIVQLNQNAEILIHYFGTLS